MLTIDCYCPCPEQGEQFFNITLNIVLLHHLLVDIINGPLALNFPTKISQEFPISPMRASSPIRLIVLNLVTLIMVHEYKLINSPYLIFPPPVKT